MTRKLLFILFLMNTSSQAQFIKNTKAFVEAGTYLSTSGKNPFWIRSNQYGIVPIESQILQLRTGFKTEYDSTKYTETNKLQKKFDYAFGGEIVGNVGKANQFLIPEAYFKTRLGAFEFYAGRRKEIVGIVDTTLSSGSYIWSGNALPIPKIQISIPNYVSIIGKGLISVKGAFAHGRFGKQEYVQNYYLHQKSLHGRIGRENQKFHAYGGVNFMVQWGGYNEFLKNNSFSSNKGYFASDFNTFLNIAIPLPFIKKLFPPKTTIGFDSDNYSGNMLGCIDFAFNYNFNFGTILFYRQFPFDTGSLFSSLVNADDGLYGLGIKINNFALINHLTFEYFHSMNQGYYRAGIARLLNIPDRHFGEVQGYFNHTQYWDGWSYNQFGIGTPFITNNKAISNPIENYQHFTSNNRVKAVFIGLNGNLKNVDYTFMTSFSSNFGTHYYQQVKTPQMNSSLNLAIPIVKIKSMLNTNISFDSGDLYDENLGFYIGMSKKW